MYLDYSGGLRRCGRALVAESAKNCLDRRLFQAGSATLGCPFWTICRSL